MNASHPAPGPGAAEPLICTCFQVTEREIEWAVRRFGLRRIEELTRHTRAGGGCHTCWPELEEILARCAQGRFKFPPPPVGWTPVLHPPPPPGPPPVIIRMPGPRGG